MPIRQAPQFSDAMLDFSANDRMRIKQSRHRLDSYEELPLRVSRVSNSHIWREEVQGGITSGHTLDEIIRCGSHSGQRHQQDVIRSSGVNR